MEPTAVIVVNYGSSALLAANVPALDDVPEQTDEPASVRIVVVDNFHSAQERQRITTLAEVRGWDLVLEENNGGFGIAVNRGVDHARALGCATFILANPDAQVPVSAIAALASMADGNRAAVVSPVIVTSTGVSYFKGSQVNMRTGRMRSQWGGDGGGSVWRDWLTGACLAFHAELWDLVGGMDEDFFLYWEDVDFSYRCLQAGAKLIIRDDVIVVHDEGGTQDRRGSAKSDIYYRYNCRNRLLFAARHVGRSDMLRWILATPRESWHILLRGGRRQLLQSSAPLRAAIAGSSSGIGLAVRAAVSLR